MTFNRTALQACLLSLPLLLLAAACTASTPGSDVVPAAPAVDAAQADPAVLAELRRELLRQLSARGITLDELGQPQRDGKAVSAIPPRVYQTPAATPVGGGVTQLYWLYDVNGDYDLNGEVNISDLTPVGLYFHATSADANWNVAQAADGDGNGEVNISDITPIGANFGVRTDGFVIEAREAAGDWREYGHVDFSSGFLSGAALEYGYNVPSGAYEAEYRVAPVGGTRDFIWDSYVLTDPSLGAASPQLAVAAGKPVLSFVDFPSGGSGYRLGFAVGLGSRPLDATQWDIVSDIGVDNAGDFAPALVVNQGTPMLACWDFNSVNYDLAYYIRDSGASPGSTWTNYILSAGSAAPLDFDLAVREGRPVLSFDMFGLNMYLAATALPTSSGDWNLIGANPALGSFSKVATLCSGPLLFSAGISLQSGSDLAFNYSSTVAPSLPGDFSEHSLMAVGSADWFPSLQLIGGVPGIAASDYTHETLLFLLANGRTPSSSGSWFSHVVAAGSSEFRKPSLALLEGRPAIAAGATTLDFHWTGGQFPDSTDDWHGQRIADTTAPGGVSLIVTDGLPLVAYCVNTAGPSGIFIAVAREQ